MTKRSRLSYDGTLASLKETIVKGGATISATIDQAAAAESLGLTLRPTTLIIFENPKGGTPLMEALRLVALDLPSKLLIWEESSRHQSPELSKQETVVSDERRSLPIRASCYVATDTPLAAVSMSFTTSSG